MLGVLLGKAVTLVLRIEPMLKPGSGFYDVLGLPGLRGTGLSVAKFPGVMGFARSSILRVFMGHGRTFGTGFGSWGCGCWR